YWVKLYPEAAETTLVYPCGAGDCPGGLVKAGGFGDSAFTFIPTPTWVDFYGQVIVDGAPARVGDVVTVYDSDGIQCGGMVIHTEGWYGLVPVYGDDETTPDVDEGAKVGDRLTFYINGQRAHNTNEVEPMWVGDGEMVQVDLAVSQLSMDTESRLPFPTEYGLSQNYPNPFNPVTHIRYQIPIRGRGTRDEGRPPTIVWLKVYNLLGQEVRTLVDETTEAGYYTVTWDGKDAYGNDVASGVYFYRLSVASGRWSEAKRMVLLR
ncbi:MAG: FlgD immunoglobulin-like domain containing protein, partial [bacterium]